MLSEEGATEVLMIFVVDILESYTWIKNLKRGKTDLLFATSYERHPQYLRMVGFQDKNLFKLSLFLEFFSKRRKCLPEVPGLFLPSLSTQAWENAPYRHWVFCLSFQFWFLDFLHFTKNVAIFRQIRKGVPLFTHAKLNCKRMCWYNYILRLHYLLQGKQVPGLHGWTATPGTGPLITGGQASCVDPLRDLRPRRGVEQLQSHLPRGLARDMDPWPRSKHYGQVSSFRYSETFSWQTVF